jgi:hypothetical protein
LKRLLLALLCCLPLVAAANEEVRYYDVEVIIFENLDQGSRTSEFWPSSVEQKPPERVIEIGRPFPGPLPRQYNPAHTFKALASDQYRLIKDAEEIEKSPTRRVLLHTAWRQPGMSEQDALSVQLQRSIPATDFSTGDARLPATPVQAGELSGFIRVILARFLHVETDILFQTQPQTAGYDIFSDSSAQQPTAYRLQQSRRRMRSNELHYIDHPVVGMLIIIRPAGEI